MHTTSADTSKKCRSVGNPDPLKRTRTGKGEQDPRLAHPLEGSLARVSGGGGGPQRRVVLGPPGCGKTARLLEILEQELDRGVQAHRIAVLTFTRAARAEVVQRVQERFRIPAKGLPWCRTIHSACFKLLELRRDQVLTDPATQEFAARHRYALSPQGTCWSSLEDAPREAPHRTRDDELRYLHEWRMNVRLTREQALARSPVERVVPLSFQRFEERLAAFKQERGLLEFADMLELVLEQGLRPPVEVVFVDEAQDLSPLQIAVVEMWFQRARRVYVAGDDDQVIYRFQGADPAWLLGLAEQVETETLTQSRRVPVAVHGLAERIIRRNRRRAEKRYLPTAEMGEVVVESLRTAMRRFAGLPRSKTSFVLVRNRAQIPRVGRELMEHVVPFVVWGPGAPNPLRSDALRRAVRAAQWLIGSDDSRETVAALRDLLERIPSHAACLPPVAQSRLAERKRAALLERGVALGELGLAGLAKAIRERGVLSVMSKVAPTTRRYLEGLLEQHAEIPEPRVVLTTIHGTKGREAHLVLLLGDMSRATHQAYVHGDQDAHESENRVFYVGVTRAIETLVLVEPRSRRHFDFPSLRGQEGVL